MASSHLSCWDKSRDISIKDLCNRLDSATLVTLKSTGKIQNLNQERPVDGCNESRLEYILPTHTEDL